MEETFINVYEFQETILKYICSDEINKIVDSTVFKDDPNGKQAIIHDMVMAALITSKCTKYRRVKEEEEESEENIYED